MKNSTAILKPTTGMSALLMDRMYLDNYRRNLAGSQSDHEILVKHFFRPIYKFEQEARRQSITTLRGMNSSCLHFGDSKILMALKSILRFFQPKKQLRAVAIRTQSVQSIPVRNIPLYGKI